MTALNALRALVLPLTVLLAASSSAQAPRDSLFWDAARPLLFSDYAATTRPTIADGYAAATTCALYVMPYAAVDGTMKWDVLAFFSRSRSWFSPFSRGDTLILKHERLHFDLVEVHARELRRFLSDLPLRGSRSEAEKLKAIIADRRALLDAEQAVYDGETVHGTYRGVQERWERDVAARLKALEAYR
jgi:hypothetical protein